MTDKSILLKTSAIGSSVINCAPHYIAVAFIGIDWSELIDASKLKKIIVSPTIGSNPYAIEALVRCVSWDNILFLDNLHTKIYIGEHCALVGSSNLSRNGLSASGLEEAAIRIEDKALVSELVEYFKELELLAIGQYPSEEKKKKKLSSLKRDWSKGIANSLLKYEEDSQRSLHQYTPLSGDDFYIVWYQPFEDYDYTDELGSVKGLIEDEMHFNEADDIEEGKWILAWRVTNSNKPDRRVRPYWLFIHEIYNNAISTADKYEYTKLAVMRTDKMKPPSPFRITDDMVNSFNEIICNESYVNYFIGNEEPFLVKNTFRVFVGFIEELKAKVMA